MHALSRKGIDLLKDRELNNAGMLLHVPVVVAERLVETAGVALVLDTSDVTPVDFEPVDVVVTDVDVVASVVVAAYHAKYSNYCVTQSQFTSCLKGTGVVANLSSARNMS